MEESYKDIRMNPNEAKKNTLIHLWGERVKVLYKNATEVQ
jgi:hypothetical protein